MPYLNWKEASLQQQVVPSEEGGRAEKLELTLSFQAGMREDLLPALHDVLTGQAPGELRLDLPRNWIVFWKLREGESRLLIAHPQPEEWVATVALTMGDAAAFLKELASLQSGASLVLSQLMTIGSVSNAEVKLVLT